MEPNKFIVNYVNQHYGFNCLDCSPEQLESVEKIEISDVTPPGGPDSDTFWDFSIFPNLKKIVCTYNYIAGIDISKNKFLEEINWSGVRGNLKRNLDFSGNPNLKKVVGGQDGLTALDLSNNPQIEEIVMSLNSQLRYINLTNCTKLKRISLFGVNIPFVDLTNCRELEECDINYWNLYKNKCDVFGDGYPRPILFVSPEFDEKIIPSETRQYSYYTYYLVRTAPNSVESELLDYLKANISLIIATSDNTNGAAVAKLHYDILEKLEDMRNPSVDLPFDMPSSPDLPF